MPSAIGKGSRTRKTLSFFRVNFGHHPPYEVLCDGPTIFQSLKNDLYLKQSLPNLLGGLAYPVVTECVVNELRSLGNDYSSAALFAKRVKRVPCVHKEKASVAECLVSRLRDLPNTNYMLASTDPDVVARVERIPGIPVVSIANQTKFFLKPPSSSTLTFVKKSERTKTHNLSDPDRALVNQVKAAEDLLREKKLVGRKRKRAKGPNPLSVKKPKVSREKNTENPLQRSAQNPGSTAFPDSDSLTADTHSKKEVLPASSRNNNEACHIKLPHEDTDSLGADMQAKNSNRLGSNSGTEVPHLDTKKAVKVIDEGQQQSAAASIVIPKPYKRRRRKSEAWKKDSTASIQKSGDRTATTIPKFTPASDDRCLLLKEGNGSVAGDVQQQGPQSVLQETSDGQGASNNSSTSMLIEGDSMPRRSGRPVCDEPVLRPKENQPIQKFTGKRQETEISAKVHENHNEDESYDTVRKGEKIVSAADNAQLTVIDGNHAGNAHDVETASVAMDGNKKKKQRKNRRRRPKKSISN